MVETKVDPKFLVLVRSGNAAGLTYDQWNYFHNEALGVFAPAFENVMPAGTPRDAVMDVETFWRHVYGATAAGGVSTVSNTRSSAWLQSLLVGAGSIGLAAATGQVPALNALIPAKWSWVIPVSTMVVQGIFGQRNLSFNPNGTHAVLPFVKR